MWQEMVSRVPTTLKRALDRLLPDGSGEERQRARILTVAGLVLVMAGVLISTMDVILWVHPAFGPPPGTDLFLDALAVLIGGLTLWLARSERIQSATWVMLASLWLVAVLHLATDGRPTTDLGGELGLFLVVVLGFVLLDRRSAWLVCILCTAAFTAIQILWLRGHLPQPVPRETSSQVTFSIITWLGIVGVIAAVILSTLEALRKHREHLEEMVEERTAQLRESEEKMRAQYKGMPIPTYTWQRVEDGFVLVDYNDAAEAITRGGIADLIGTELNDMYRDIPQIREDVERCYTEGITIEREMSYRYISTDERKDLAVKYAFVPPDLVLVHTEDISERKEMEELLLRQERLAMLGQLAGSVSHELRGPLGAINNAAYLLQVMLEEPASEVSETLSILQEEVDRSETIISGLLDLARIKTPIRRPANVNRIVEEAFSRTDVPEDIETDLRLDDSLPTILADPDQLDQVFGNLIRNAIQAMSPLASTGQENGRLTIKTFKASGTPEKAAQPEWVAVSIADTGVGIPEENQEKIFEPLFTTRARGIGLGLTVVKTLVEGHGGTIEVESEVGEGSRFTVRLPLAKEQESR